MTPAIFNFEPHRRGATIRPHQFALDDLTDEGVLIGPKDLTGYTLLFEFRLRGSSPFPRRFTIGAGITIPDPTTGIFTLDAFKLEYPGTWEFDLEVTTPEGYVDVYIEGTITITDDVSKRSLPT